MFLSLDQDSQFYARHVVVVAAHDYFLVYIDTLAERRASTNSWRQPAQSRMMFEELLRLEGDQAARHRRVSSNSICCLETRAIRPKPPAHNRLGENGSRVAPTGWAVDHLWNCQRSSVGSGPPFRWCDLATRVVWLESAGDDAAADRLEATFATADVHAMCTREDARVISLSFE